MTTKKINANDLAADIQAGMDHEQLMEKYDLPSDTLQRFYRELAAGGTANSERLAELTDPLENATGPAGKCPACGYSQTEAFDECPVCGVVVRKFKKSPEQDPQSGSRDDILYASTSSSDADDEDVDVDDDADDEAEQTSDANPPVHSGGIVSHVLEWVSDTASSISETISETVSDISQSVSDLTSGSADSAEGESAGDDSSDGGDSGGDSGSDGGGGDD